MSNETPTVNRPPLAIVGVSALFPGSLDASGFWNDILAGRDLIQDVPKSHWLLEDYYDEDMTAVDKTYATRGAFLKDVPFDPLEWGVPPSIVPATDTSQLLALIMAKRVLQDASQGQFQDMDTKRMSVILGVTSAQELLGSMNSRLQKPMWKKVLRDSGLPESKVQELLGRIDGEYVPWQEATFPGLLGNVVAGRIANRLDLGGTNCVCDAACASAFSAINMAANELWLGQSDVVITGGVDTMNDIFMFMCFSKTPALSKSGDVKPFSDEADGTMLGEGLGMVAIKRLADAEANGDRIYAVLNGIGASSDGRAKSVYAPRPSGQRLALDRAYANAGYGMDTVEIVEAHGTGTIAGDAAEFEGLKMAFGEAHPDKKQWAALGSVKSQIGHTKAAAGSAGLFKMVMALHHKVLPPTIKVDRPNPKMDLENSPFYLSTRARPWVRGPEHPRRAGVSSFGFGGSNFHLALEEYTGSAEKAFRRRVSETELVVFSADNAQALDAQLAGIELGGAGFLEWFARDSQANFEPKSVRAAIVATDEADLAKQIETLRGHLAKKPGKKLNSPKGLYLSFDAVAGDVGFLFPGQGSQYVDMGAKVAMTWPLALSAWDTAAGIAELTELHDVVFPKPDFSDGSAWQKTLTETQWAQPAIGAASLSLYRLLTAAGVKPAAVGGHSYGEVTALHAAGVLTADDMLRVARKRGELMAEAAKTPGSMTAVVADVADVKPVVEASGLDVVIANHNSPSQAVLSGPTADIDAIEKKLDDAGLSYKRLGVATAFHSSVVSASVEPFAEFLATVDFGEATVPVYANSEAAPYPAGADDKRSILGNQIARGVRFVEQVEAMYAAGIRTFIEVGPHAVLTGLVGKILKGKEFTAVNLDRKGKDGLKALNEALGKLVVAGVEVNLSAFWDGVQPAVDPRSVPAPKMVLKINGANYGKPYPPPEGASALPGPNPEIEPEVIVKEVIKEVVKEVRVEVPVEVPVHVPVAAQPTQAAPVAYAAPVAPASAWVQAFQDSQRQTVEAHAAFQDAMSRSHTAFLESMERSFVQLTGMVTGQAVAAPVMPVAPVVHAVMPQVVAPVAPVIHAPVAATPVQTAVDIDSLLTTPGAPSPVAAPVVAAPVAVAAAPSRDLNQLMLDVVADKTGYPAEMLGLEMTLEGDLGIDSIKRVEILSAMRDAEPSLPEVDAGEMASLQTLGQIVAYMADQMGAVPVASAPVAVAASSSIDLNQLMLDVVADKTGYPAEMLGLEMTLEGDLGIDSIKRVEILSAMRDAEPSLPEVDASEMATLQTLGQIVDYMDAQLGQVSAPVVAAPVAAAPASTANIHQLMLDVVAERTGYPAEMLTMEMSLEGDLGIDSIKRVEILSAMTDAEPTLPEVDASEMASLQTLGQIVDYMNAQMGTTSAPAAAAPVAAASTANIHQLMLDVVAEKTGYPAEMLTMEMSLEGDLGIDSIKRVEILSAMTDAEPTLPEVDASEMASLQTLGQIVDYMNAQMGVTGSPAPATEAAPSTANIHQLMLDVVAEKTGYPAEMLTMEMSLEGDLGIDSIKRVEILSAMTDAEPTLPEVDASEMASLQTLGQIVDYMNAQMGVSGTPAATAVETVVETKKTAALGRFLVEAVDAPAVGLSLKGFAGKGPVYIVGGSGEVATAVAGELTDRGVTVEVVTDAPEGGAKAIFLGGLAQVDADGAREVNRHAFRTARTLAKQASLFVTVQDTGADFGLSGSDNAWVGGLAALVKTASQEWKDAGLRALDIEVKDRTPSELATVLVDELLDGGNEREVGLAADGTRRTLVANLTPVEGGDATIDADSVVLASGGARGVTAATLIELSARTKATFLLMGRTPLVDEDPALLGLDETGLKRHLLMAAKASGELVSPAVVGKKVSKILAQREVRGTLAKMAANGSSAQYLACDVTDEAGIRAAIETANVGKVTAIVHGAGVLADRYIADKTNDQFDFVFDTKVNGLRALLAATGSELSALVLFSSVAARGGNAGQCDYAMANEVLNKVAWQFAAQNPGTLVKSLGWGPWEGGMVTPALKARFESLGVPLIPLQSGANMLCDELLSSARTSVELVLGGEPTEEALIDDGDRDRVDFELVVTEKSMPWLNDHSIQGAPVVPVVLAAEWFARAARGTRPDLKLVAVQEIKVLRGIRIADFAWGAVFTVTSKQLRNGQGALLALELRGADGTLHYTANAELADDARVGGSPLAEHANLETWKDEVYDGHMLFHGPEFQVIRELEGVSDEGAAAVLEGVQSRAWNQTFTTDVAAMDGGLQLAVLWAKRMLGGASLPTKLGEMTVYAEGPAKGPIKAVLQARKVTSATTVSDIVFQADGNTVAELKGVETCLRPS